MAKKKTVIEIIVDNIVVDEDDYYFDYIVKVNGEMKLSDSYSGDYDGGDIEEIKKSLENGMAEDLILEDFGHDLFNY